MCPGMGPGPVVNGVDGHVCTCGYRGIWLRFLRSSVLTVIV